jgi:uncharacterized protein YndB with AHSA1/START domain
MSGIAGPAEIGPRDLRLERTIDAPPALVYRAWTEPALLQRWFAPRPWTTPRVELDVRRGGASLIVMRDPEGNDYPNRSVYLEVDPGRRLVFTDAFVAAWEPSEAPFMTVSLTFEEAGGKTLYTALVRHWTLVDRKRHEDMGFQDGWGRCADQMAQVVASL